MFVIELSDVGKLLLGMNVEQQPGTDLWCLKLE